MYLPNFMTEKLTYRKSDSNHNNSLFSGAVHIFYQGVVYLQNEIGFHGNFI